jgi:hypothetical protein
MDHLHNTEKNTVANARNIGCPTCAQLRAEWYATTTDDTVSSSNCVYAIQHISPGDYNRALKTYIDHRETCPIARAEMAKYFGQQKEIDHV